MRKLLTILLCAAGSCLMAQTVQQTQPVAPASVSHQKPGTMRLHVYTTYAFDDKVDSYYSNSSYFEGKINKIEELEETRLNFFAPDVKAYYVNEWQKIISSGVI